MIFADPPYFLSSGGISVQSGKVVCVDKGDWDKRMSLEEINNYNHRWISLCRDKLKDNGTIWISGTYHNIFSVANALSLLGFKILNVITWAKTNPPPNISCRYFTYSTEFIIWARKKEKVAHYYNNIGIFIFALDSENNAFLWSFTALRPYIKLPSEISDSFIRDIEKFGTKGDQMKVVIVSIDENNGFLRVSYKRVPKEEAFSSHNNNLRKVPETSSEDFKPLEEKLPEWIAATLKEAKENESK